MTPSALLHSHSIEDDRFTIYPDIEWQQFKLIQAGFAKSHGILTRCVLMAQTSRLEAALEFRKAIKLNS